MNKPDSTQTTTAAPASATGTVPSPAPEAAPVPITTAPSAAVTTIAPTTAPDSALSTMPQIIELADQLSAFADQLHERIMADIRSHAGRTVPESTRDAMRALSDDEMLLRQRANSLYADAASFVIRDLGRPQGQLIALTKDAAQKIRRIGIIGEATGLVGGLLSLAGATMAGQPAGIVLALDKIRLHTGALQLLSPTPPTTPA